MPVYDYECRACERKFEIRRRITEPRDDVCCPECQGTDIAQIMGTFMALGLSSKRSSGGGSCSDCGRGSCSGCHGH